MVKLGQLLREQLAMQEASLEHEREAVRLRQELQKLGWRFASYADVDTIH